MVTTIWKLVRTCCYMLEPEEQDGSLVQCMAPSWAAGVLLCGIAWLWVAFQ